MHVQAQLLTKLGMPWQGQLGLSNSCRLRSTKVAQVTHLAGGNAQLPAEMLNTLQEFGCWTCSLFPLVSEVLLLQLSNPSKGANESMQGAGADAAGSTSGQQ